MYNVIMAVISREVVIVSPETVIILLYMDKLTINTCKKNNFTILFVGNIFSFIAKYDKIQQRQHVKETNLFGK
ncbi:hypothetical protein acsn021_30050 [Anaerocolumna cellulosilytica]|uniref:Uncharacterized protein n=1 Tax=Anaerocolumna cellulosilytica TaxID=433286 RepID=A0A6S6R071_9FIRM|nr:hypothetical protein acsn021_30050 [Anaerocolumna cellulosilytica]